MNNHLTEAARYGDAQTEERGLEEYIKSLDIGTLDELLHIAEQRALRAVLIKYGRKSELDEVQRLNKPTPIRLTERQQRDLAAFTPMYLDGIALGWKAHDLKESA